MNEKSKSVKISDLLNRPIQDEETVFSLVETLEQGGKRLEIASRQLPPAPPQLPPLQLSKHRKHEFHDVEGFARYLKDNGGSSSVVLANTGDMSAKCVLDEECGEGGYEILTFRPKFHPLFVTWLGVIDRSLPVMDFAQFVMQNRRTVENGRDLALTFSQIKASKKIEIQQGRGQKALNGVMVLVEINGTKTESPVELPESMVLEVPIFIQSWPARIELDLLVHEKNEQVFVHVSAGDLQAVQAKQFMEDIRKLQELVPDVNCTFGVVAHEPLETI